MTDTCKKCGRSTSSGSITQWITACKCAQLDAPKPEDKTREICQTCGKLIGSGRSGSMTMWVFGPNNCVCKAPTVLPAAENQQTPSDWLESLSVDDDLTVDWQLFPQDRYKPLERLGHGAAGTVYLCADLILRKKVAVKTLHDLTAEQLIAFQKEAKATSTLKHSGIVTILDFGVNEGVAPYMVMDYLPGRALDQILSERGTISVEELVELTLQLCDAIGYAHKNGIFHRDLKPSNILISQQDDRMSVHVIDFGIAKVRTDTVARDEQALTLAGTPSYMSPDQAAGNSFDARSDIYSLGCIMFECLAGHVPFRGDTALETMAMHANAEPPPLPDDIPDGLNDIVICCLSKDPDERFQNTGELANALRDLDLIDEENSVSSSPKTSTSVSMKQISLVCLIGLLVAIVLFFIAKGLGVDELVGPEKKARPNRSFAVGLPLLGEPTLTSDEIENAEELDQLQPFVTHLSLYKDVCNAQSLKKIAKRCKLNSIDVAGGSLNDKCMEAIGSMTTLKRLWMNGAKDFSAEGMAKLKGLTQLEELQIKSTMLDDEELGIIAQIGSIKKLYINDCKLVTDKGLKSVASMPHLVLLQANGTSISDDGLSSLEQAQKAIARNKIVAPLLLLHIARCKITDKGLQSLTHLQNLRSLDIADNSISNRGLRSLASMHSLTRLGISNLPATNGTVKMIAANLQGMKVLDLRGTKIDTAGILELKNIKQLVVVDISNLHLSDKTLASWQSNQLQMVNLSQNDFTIPGVVKWLNRSPSMRTLILDKAHVLPLEKATSFKGNILDDKFSTHSFVDTTLIIGDGLSPFED